MLLKYVIVRLLEKKMCTRACLSVHQYSKRSSVRPRVCARKSMRIRLRSRLRSRLPIAMIQIEMIFY